MQLLKYYRKYKEEGLEITKEIYKKIEEYKSEKDEIKQFVEECIEKSETHVKTNEVYLEYKD